MEAGRLATPTHRQDPREAVHSATARPRGTRGRPLCASETQVTVGTWTEMEMELAVNRTLIAVATLALAACGSASATSDFEEAAESGSASEDTEAEREAFDEDAAREKAEAEVASEGYDGPCTQDCSGHDAGFGWAAAGNPDGGTSSSQSFDEGQQAYEDAVEDRIEEDRQAYEGGEGTDY